MQAGKSRNVFVFTAYIYIKIMLMFTFSVLFSELVCCRWTLVISAYETQTYCFVSSHINIQRCVEAAPSLISGLFPTASPLAAVSILLP